MEDKPTKKSLSFGELVARLPRAQSWTLANQRHGIEVPEGQSRRFVEPTVSQALEDPSPVPVLLLKAPGAVGKSTLARELAVATGSPLWNLSHFTVGDNTLHGTLVKLLGASRYGEVVADLKNGDRCIIIDALDEAQARAGDAGFEAFIRDIGDLFRATSSSPGLVLLGRRDSVAFAEMILEDCQVAASTLEIEFFDEVAARDFLDIQLDDLAARRKEEQKHRVQRQPFEEARDLLFENVDELLSSGSQGALPWTEHSRSFLGYAPVLEAFAEYLGFENYRALKNDIEDLSGSGSQWGILRQIVADLLIREQGKFHNAFRERGSRLEAVDWTQVYTPEEQCRRLLARGADRARVPVPQSVSREDHQAYNDVLEIQLPIHPFIGEQFGGFANLVFSEFVSSWALLSDTEAREAEWRRMCGGDIGYLPTPLLAQFYIAASSERGGDQTATIHAADIGLVLESISAQESNVHFAIFEDAVGTEYVEVHADDSCACVARMRIHGPGPIHFPRRLERTVISGVERDIVLGAVSQNFVLAPDVYVETPGVLEVRADTVHVRRPEPGHEGGVLLISGSYSGFARRVHVAGQRSDLDISWPNAVHPWAAYYSERGSILDDLLPEMHADVFKKFLHMFRTIATRKVTTVHSKRVSEERARLRDELVDLAQKERVLTKEGAGFGEIYRFNNTFRDLYSVFDGQLPQGQSLKFIKMFAPAKADD